MALLLVLLCTILAFSLASTQQCVSSPSSSIDLSLHSHKNASGDWIITVETRRLTFEEDTREMSVDVHHETKICGRKQIEQLIAVALVYPSLDDTSMTGAIELSTTRPTITTTATLSATATPSTTTTVTSSTTTTTTSSTTPNPCPHSGYQLYPGYNCYKAFPSRDESKTWSEAREQCMRDGGDLMVMESHQEKLDVYFPLYNSVNFRYSSWVGVYVPKGGNVWKSVKGQPAHITWWEPGYPKKYATRKCAAYNSRGLLVNYNCEYTLNFICEIPL